MEPPNSKIASAGPVSSGGKGSFYLSSRTKIWVLAVCLTLMIAASVYAVLQPLNPHPSREEPSARFWYPHETNPYARLQAVSCPVDKSTGKPSDYACRLNSVAVNGTGDRPEVWAVGNVGLVLHRKAGESKWEQLTITAKEENASAPPPTPTPKHSATPTPAHTPTPAPTATPTPTPTPTPGPTEPMPNLIGLTLEDAQAKAAKAGFKLVIEYESGRAPDPTAQQAPPDLRVIKQTPTRVPSTIRVTLGRPKAAVSLLDRLVPSVYAAEPEKRPSPAPQQSPAPANATRATPNVPGGQHLQPQNSTGAAPADAPAPFDDDLIFAGCDQRGCHALGRSGRIYTMDSNSEWSFTQASFVISANAPVKSFVPLNVLSWQNLMGASGSAIYRCSMTTRASSVEYECDPDSAGVFVSADNLLKIHLANGQETDFFQFAVIGSGRVQLFLGTSGEVRKVRDKGDVNSGERIPSHTTATLRSFAFGSADAGTHGFIVGDQGIILSTADGGSTWRHETQGPEGAAPNRRLPAPWYWVLAFVLLVTSSAAVAAPSRPPVTEVSVADWTVTDAPLKSSDQDALDFTPMALGLSRFIRNPQTQPPVTIAIEGEWGEGKSSVMGLLRGDLEKSRFRPVWFNAWHHQSEEQLLAALLEHIKSEAIPPWWHIDNWIFRARLLRIRFRKKWPLMIILIVALVGAVAFELARHGLQMADVIKFRDDCVQLVKYLLPWTKETHPPDDLNHFGVLATVLAIFAAILQKAKAFGINPAKLTDNLRDATTIKDVKPEPGIRRQFASEFGDLCNAWSWGGRRVIIFIDDLDRCRPESVVTVLESINFLTTAGDCMIVLGMAQKQVTHCVGLSFKDIAQAEEAYKGGGNTEQEKAIARFNYGAFYIKKLVNIVAPLPKTTQEQRRRVLEVKAAAARRQDQEENAPGAAKWRVGMWGWLDQVGRITFKVAPVLGLVLAVVLSVLIGYRKGVQPEPAPAPQGQTAASQENKTDKPPTQEDQKLPGGPATPLPYHRPTTDPAKLADSDHPTGGVAWSYAVDALFLLVLFGILAYQLSTRTNQDAQNSPEFEESLALWGKYILGICDTPREIKRALNDLRYQAMTRRNNGPSITRGERMVRALRQFVTGHPEPAPTETRVDEAALPPRKAAELANLTDEEWKAFLDPYNVEVKGSENLKLLIELKVQHLKHFQRWVGEVKPATVASGDGKPPESNTGLENAAPGAVHQA